MDKCVRNDSLLYSLLKECTSGMGYTLHIKYPLA